jgi:hypothetical protein
MLQVLRLIFTLCRDPKSSILQQVHASWAAALTDGLSLHIEAATGALLLCYNMLHLSCDGAAGLTGAAQLHYVRQQAHASWAAALTDGLSLHIEAATGALLLCYNMLHLSCDEDAELTGAAQLRYVRQQVHASWAAALTDGLSLHIEAATGVLLLFYVML